MKRTLTLLAIAAALAFGCQKNETVSSDTSSTTSTSYSDTANTSSSSTAVTATDTSATTSTNPATSSTTGTAMGQSGATLTKDEQDLMTKAAQGGLAEVSLGQTAAQKATNPDVKSFAQKMVADHGKANDQLKQVATSKGFTLPTDTDAEHKAVVDKIDAQSAAKFDKAYMDAMVKDHDKTVKELEGASSKVKDPDLKSWLDQTLPVVKQHQSMAHDLDKKLK